MCSLRHATRPSTVFCDYLLYTKSLTQALEGHTPLFSSSAEPVIEDLIRQQASVQVGEPVVVIVEDKDLVPAFSSYTADDAKGGSNSVSATPHPSKSAEAWPKQEHRIEPASSREQPASAPAPAPTKRDGKRVVASPYARRLAREQGVSLDGVSASGPNGRIVASDVKEAIESGATAPAAGAGAQAGSDGDMAFADIDVSNIKKVTAKRLLESKTTVPHYYLSVECNVEQLTAMRAAINKTLEKDGGKVSVNDFVIKAAAAALKKVPEVNASWRGDTIRQYENVDITVAVQTKAGLMVPVVRDADLKGLATISSEVKDLAGKVRCNVEQVLHFVSQPVCCSRQGRHSLFDSCCA